VVDTDQTKNNIFLDTIYIDHMYIESSTIPEIPDTISPATITNLGTATGGSGQVILTWTAPGDDGTVGTCNEYDIRYVPALDGPITDLEWDSATQVSGEPTPSTAGTPETMTISGLVPDASYYFAIKAVDEASNWSGLSNSPLGQAGTESSTEQDHANQDIPVTGTVSGGYADTHTTNDIHESITEIRSPGRSNKSYLEHKWTVNVTGGTIVTFKVEAHHTLNPEGDDFAFAYSTDDSTYTTMITVTKTSDDDTYQTYALPSGLSGTVYIRVVDSDQTKNNITLDTIHIDHMFIESSP
jgi:hypothetical protein